GSRLAVSGHFESREGRATFAAAAQRMFADYELVDETAYASGAADGFFDAARLALSSLAGMTGGRISVEGSQVELVGFVTRAAARTRGEALLRERLPDGFTLISRVAVRQPLQPLAAEPCSTDMTSILASGRLEFGDGADLSADSYPVLDRVAATMARCPPVLVEVGVHSDSDGSRTANRQRTQERADTIVEYLVDAGVQRERLTATGFGESQPVADNSTPAGKSQNRRITFAVAVSEPVGALEAVPKPEAVSAVGSEPREPDADAAQADSTAVEPDATTTSDTPVDGDGAAATGEDADTGGSEAGGSDG
ncbi:MAG: OmpA family protein, partial [Alphaproteobacteria bacterium]